MSLSLPKPAPQYDLNNEAQTRAAIETNDRQVMKTTQDIVVRNRRFILQSPDGTLFSVTVANDGTLSATAI